MKIKEDLEKVDNYLNKEEEEEEINTSTIGGEEWRNEEELWRNLEWRINLLKKN